MPQGKLRGGGLRGEVQSTVRESYGVKATSNFKSRVVHPRNPKLVKGRPEDDKVSSTVGDLSKSCVWSSHVILRPEFTKCALIFWPPILIK